MANIFSGMERTFAPPTVVASRADPVSEFLPDPLAIFDDEAPAKPDATKPEGSSSTGIDVPRPPRRPEFPTNEKSSYAPAHFSQPPIFSGQPTSGGYKQPLTGLSPDAAKLAQKWAGASRGESGECVALVKEATNVGHTSTWRPGGAIGPDTPIGTPIATFGDDGRYKNIRGQSHAALYLGQGSTPGSIKVLDQWRGHAAGVREIQPGSRAESAQNFRAIVSSKNG